MFEAGDRGTHHEAVAAALDAWAAVDVVALSPAAVRRELKQIETLRARLDALAAVRLACVGGDLRRFAREELGLSGRDATQRDRVARLVNELPEAGDALARAAVSMAHLDAVAREAEHLTDAQKAQLVEAAQVVSPDELAHRARSAAIAWSDVDGATLEHRRWERRRVIRTIDVHGMRLTQAELDTESDQILFNALTLVMDQQWRMAHPNREPAFVERPPFAQRLADALIEMARRTIARTNDVDAGGGSPFPAAAQPILNIHIDHQTLSDGLHALGICETAFGEPLAPDNVRRLACHAKIIPVVFGSKGEVLDFGRARRLPTPAQRAAVYARDRRCRFPGCATASTWTEIHHITSWIDGGETNLDNLVPLCSRHHHLVHDGGWSLTGTATDIEVGAPHQREGPGP